MAYKESQIPGHVPHPLSDFFKRQIIVLTYLNKQLLPAYFSYTLSTFLDI